MPWILLLTGAALWAMFLIPIWQADRESRSLGAARLDSGVLQPSNSEARLRPIKGRVLARHGDEGHKHRDLVLVRRRRVMLTLLGAAVATLAGWFVFNSLWMILIHLIVDAVFAWYITMLRRIRTFREDVEALVAEHDGDLPPTRESPTLRLVQPR